jgi:purine-nucleoside phosphorylase
MAMSHLDAKPGDIAEIVLMPGDPLRGQRIAEEMLTEPRCHNRHRNVLGFTGLYAGTPVSVQASGMGAPSMAIYATELLTGHGARVLIRVGTCASLGADADLGDLIVAMGAATDSRLAERWVPGVAFAATASYPLVSAAERSARERGHPFRVGQVMTSDVLYGMDPETLVGLADMGVLGLDMETAALYGVAARHRAAALSVLTVTDDLETGAHLPPAERESGYRAMVEVALDAALAVHQGAPA